MILVRARVISTPPPPRIISFLFLNQNARIIYERTRHVICVNLFFLLTQFTLTVYL